MTVEKTQLPHWQRVALREGYRSKGNVVACENCGREFETDDFQRMLFETTKHRNLECPTPDVPRHCAQVGYSRHQGERFEESAATAMAGDLVWDPKMGEGHVASHEEICGRDHRYCGYCGGWGEPHTYLVCECGGLDTSDHHQFILRSDQ